MSLRRLCAALAFTLLPAILPAQPAPVQSGEHANFTRIVVTLPPEADWKVTQQGQSVVLQVVNFTKGFETSGFFRRIPQDRISGVEAEAGSLVLTLACDCRAAVFEEQNRHVVIDVALADVRLPVAFIPLEKAPAGKLPALPQIPRPLPQRVARQTTEDMVNSLGRTPLAPEAQVALDEMQQRLAEEIAAATSRGLLEVTVPPIALPPEKDTVPETAETAANPLPDLFNNLRVSSSMDLPARTQPGQRPPSPDGITCTPDADVALSQWGDDRPAALQISKARSTLWQDDGTLNAEAALALARLYLHLGFGVEAADLLEQIPEAPEPLIALAQIMEQEPSANLPALSRQRYCRGDISLWAILATPLPVPPPRIDPGPPLLALNKLPQHLRRMVAPALSERFVSNGNPNAAAAALRSIERAKKPDDLPAAARLARADLALKSGQKDEGTAELAALSTEGSPEAPAALIALVDARLAANQPIDPETAKLVATYAYEMRKSPLGAELRRAHVLP